MIDTICQILEDDGPMTLGELARAVHNELLCDEDQRCAMSAVYRAIDSAIGLGYVEVAEHHDARARQGGAAALLRVVNPNDAESARRDRGLPARDGTTR